MSEGVSSFWVSGSPFQPLPLPALALTAGGVCSHEPSGIPSPFPGLGRGVLSLVTVIVFLSSSPCDPVSLLWRQRPLVFQDVSSPLPWGRHHSAMGPANSPSFQKKPLHPPHPRMGPSWASHPLLPSLPLLWWCGILQDKCADRFLHHAPAV